MKIDELISELEQVREEHGNLEVEVTKHDSQKGNIIKFDSVEPHPELVTVKLKNSIYF